VEILFISISVSYDGGLASMAMRIRDEGEAIFGPKQIQLHTPLSLFRLVMPGNEEAINKTGGTKICSTVL
jgi:hypothetical protein